MPLSGDVLDATDAGAQLFPGETMDPEEAGIFGIKIRRPRFRFRLPGIRLPIPRLPAFVPKLPIPIPTTPAGLVRLARAVGTQALRAAPIAPGPLGGALAGARALMAGQSLAEVAKQAALGAVPAGPLAQRLAAVGLAGLRGENIARALREQAMAELRKRAGILPLTAPDPLAALTPGRAPMGLLPAGVEKAALALAQTPALRAVPVRDLGPELGVTPLEAREGLASLLGALRRVGAGDIEAADIGQALRLEPDVAGWISPRDSFDSAAPRIASRAAPPQKTGKRPPVRRGPPPPRRIPPAPPISGFRPRTLSAQTIKYLLALVPSARKLPPAALARLAKPHPSAAPHPAYRPKGAADAGAYDVPARYNVPRREGDAGAYDVPARYNVPQREMDAGQLFPPVAPPSPPVTPVGEDLGKKLGDIIAKMPPGGGPVTQTGPQVQQAQVMVAGWMRRVGLYDPPDYGAKETEFDGKNGPRTHRAIRLFQKWTNDKAKPVPPLRQDGEIDQRTYDALVAASEEEGKKVPPVPPPGPPVPGVPPEFVPPVVSPDLYEAQWWVAAWGLRTGAVQPPDFGAQKDDYQGTYSPRFRKAVQSFQVWFNAQQEPGAKKMRTDGMLDVVTSVALQGFLSKEGIEPRPPPPPPWREPGVVTPPGVPPPMPPAKKDNILPLLALGAVGLAALAS